MQNIKRHRRRLDPEEEREEKRIKEMMREAVKPMPEPASRKYDLTREERDELRMEMSERM